MSKQIFLFNLDLIVTKQEILPLIAKKAGVYELMCALAESNVRGETPYKQSFLKRMDLLKDISVSEVKKIVTNIEVNEQLVDFIKKYKERCYIVTENIDVWIAGLIERLGMEKNVYCSKAFVKNDFIQEIVSVIDKNAVINQIVVPYVAVGNGNNDTEMISAAEVGIGYGGVYNVASSVLDCASHVMYSESKLVDFLGKLI